MCMCIVRWVHMNDDNTSKMITHESLMHAHERCMHLKDACTSKMHALDGVKVKDGSTV